MGFRNQNQVIKFAVAGTSKIKIEALQEALAELSIKGVVTPIPGAESGIGEQPMGDDEILLGATNRVTSAYRLDSTHDIYIGIENGIDKYDDRWYDYAIVLAYLPGGNTYSVKSQWVNFPREAVGRTARKPGGFGTNTVGKTLVEMGIVNKHDDPHIDLCGIPRKDLLREALEELLMEKVGLGL